MIGFDRGLTPPPFRPCLGAFELSDSTSSNSNVMSEGSNLKIPMYLGERAKISLRSIRQVEVPTIVFVLVVVGDSKLSFLN